MIRFRIGQRWRRESATAPQDSLGLEVHGLDLLGGEASEEPLVEVIPDLVEAVRSLWTEGEPLAQVSLPESHLELCFLRQGDEVELAVASLGRPARLARPGVRLELSELAEATARCGRTLQRDLASSSPTLASSSRARRMARQLADLQRPGPSPLRRLFARGGYGYRRFPLEPVSFAFELLDEKDRLLAYDRRGLGALASLLCEGSVSLHVGKEELWGIRGPPFLLALELSRQAVELTRSIELGERRLSLIPGGTGRRMELRLPERTLEVNAHRHAVDPLHLARAMFELGLALAFALGSHNKAQVKNPYMEELTARCREGLSHLRPAAGPPTAGPPALERERAPAASPLSKAGKLRRLRFEKLWVKQGLGDEEPGTLLLGGRGPLFSSPRLACGFSTAGRELFRRTSDHGVAVSREGRTLCASADRILYFKGAEPSARWLRNHDGLPVGPLLQRRQELLLTTSEEKVALAFSEATGRELWRAAPARTQRVHLAVQGHRALLTTDSGYLYGLDLDDGRSRYRIRSSLPFLGPAVPWGRRMAALLGREDRSALLCAEAHSGQVHWTRELSLSRPSPPLPVGGKLALAGERDGQGWVACFSSRGAPLWERPLHLGRGPYRLLAVGRAILAVSPSGAATLLEPTGEVRWHLGAAGEPIARAPAPVASRSVLLIPGERVRAVDPHSGLVLAEVTTDPGLCDLKVDGRLNLYLLDEHGTLAAYRLSTHLTVVGG